MLHTNSMALIPYSEQIHSSSAFHIPFYTKRNLNIVLIGLYPISLNTICVRGDDVSSPIARL